MKQTQAELCSCPAHLDGNLKTLSQHGRVKVNQALICQLLFSNTQCHIIPQCILLRLRCLPQQKNNCVCEIILTHFANHLCMLNIPHLMHAGELAAYLLRACYVEKFHLTQHLHYSALTSYCHSQSCVHNCSLQNK